ncbi:hypothetical protein GW931_01860 [archaeon]|nr:hypothetical protein [archaeon]
MNRKAQSEMVGFGIIVIIIAVLILVFISISLSNNSSSESQSYKSEAFVQSYLQFTTTCEKNTRVQSNLELIKLCKNSGTCDDGTLACKVLNETSKDILESAWKVGEDFPVKGYEFSIFSQGNPLLEISKGNKTSESRGSSQVFSEELQIDFISYY